MGSNPVKVPLHEWLQQRRIQNRFVKLCIKEGRKKKTNDFEMYYLYYELRIKSFFSDIKYLSNRRNWW